MERLGDVFIGHGNIGLAAHFSGHHAVFVDIHYFIAAGVVDASRHSFAVDLHRHGKRRFSAFENVDGILKLRLENHSPRIVFGIISLEHERVIRKDFASHDVAFMVAFENIAVDFLFCDGGRRPDLARLFLGFRRVELVAVVALEIVLHAVSRGGFFHRRTRVPARGRVSRRAAGGCEDHRAGQSCARQEFG